MLQLTDKVIRPGGWWLHYRFHLPPFGSLTNDPLRLFDINGGDMVLFQPPSPNRWDNAIITTETTLARLLEIEPTLEKIMLDDTIVWERKSS